MKLRVIAVGAAAVTVGAVAVFSGAGSAQEPQGRTLTITDSRNGATFAFIDNAPKTRLVRGEPHRMSVGDEIVLVNRLTTESGGRGRGSFHCAVLEAARGSAGKAVSLCTVDLTLPDGHLTGSGKADFFANRLTFPITGGTGAYAGARGTLTRVEGPERVNGGTDTIRLLP